MEAVHVERQEQVPDQILQITLNGRSKLVQRQKQQRQEREVFLACRMHSSRADTGSHVNAQRSYLQARSVTASDLVFKQARRNLVLVLGQELEKKIKKLKGTLRGISFI